MFSCKAIRRPEFVEAAMEFVNEDKKLKKTKVSNKMHNLSSASTLHSSRIFMNKYDDEELDDFDPSCRPGNYMMLQAGGIRKVGGVI